MTVRLHATTFLIGEVGVLVRGASGSGKSSLALTCLAIPPTIPPAIAPAPVRLVADDQTVLTCHGGRLVARAPDTIRGRIELRGIGIMTVAVEPACIVRLVVDRAAGPRLPSVNLSEVLILGVAVPHVVIAPDDPDAAARLVHVLAGHVGSSRAVV